MKESEWIEKIENTAPTKRKIVGNFLKQGFSFASKEFASGIIGGISGGVVGYIIAKIFGT